MILLPLTAYGHHVVATYCLTRSGVEQADHIHCQCIPGNAHHVCAPLARLLTQSEFYQGLQFW